MSTTAPVIEPIIDSFMSAEEAAARYPGSPMYDPAIVPKGYAGSIHIGDGVWRTICHECDHAVDSYGSVPRYRTVGPHEVEAHGLQVGGINVGILP